MSEYKIIPIDNIQNLIYTIGGTQVMLDSDLAQIYGVETKVLNRAVGRNVERFPDNFRFQLSKKEYDNLRAQNDTSKNNSLRFQNGTLEKGGGFKIAKCDFKEWAEMDSRIQ